MFVYLVKKAFCLWIHTIVTEIAIISGSTINIYHFLVYDVYCEFLKKGVEGDFIKYRVARANLTLWIEYNSQISLSNTVEL